MRNSWQPVCLILGWWLCWRYVERDSQLSLFLLLWKRGQIVLHVETHDTGSQNSGMRCVWNFGKQFCDWFVLFSDLGCLACISCWHDGHGRMRLYLQQGLSDRVIQALQLRLTRVLNMANGSESYAPGMVEEGRTRSRSRGREATESDMPERAPGVSEETPDMPEGAPDAMTAVPEVPGGVPTPPPAASSVEIVQLTQKIEECATKIGSVAEDLAIVLDHFNDGRDELKKGFQELSIQLKGTAQCITTMSAGVTFQSGEITKLLKAFDRWSITGRWALGGSHSIETNVQKVQGEIGKQAEKLESRLAAGFEDLAGCLHEMLQVLRERSAGSAPFAAISPTFPPSFPQGVPVTGAPLTPGVGAMGTPATSVMPSGVRAPPAPPAVAPEVVAPSEFPVSIFMGYCPLNPGDQKPTRSFHAGVATPRQRQNAVMTRDATTGAHGALSPTPYTESQTYALVSAWAPGGLAMIRDGRQECRRVYQWSRKLRTWPGGLRHWLEDPELRLLRDERDRIVLFDFWVKPRRPIPV